MIILLGASGFIGTYLADELFKRKEPLIACGRNRRARAFFEEINLPWADVDITRESDFEQLPATGVKAVVLLSAMVPANVADYHPQHYIDTNLTGTLNALDTPGAAAQRSSSTLLRTPTLPDSGTVGGPSEKTIRALSNSPATMRSTSSRRLLAWI